MADHPPPVNRITDTCKNITLPQLRLRAVINDKHLRQFSFSIPLSSAVNRPLQIKIQHQWIPIFILQIGRRRGRRPLREDGSQRNRVRRHAADL